MLETDLIRLAERELHAARVVDMLEQMAPELMEYHPAAAVTAALITIRLTTLGRDLERS